MGCTIALIVETDDVKAEFQQDFVEKYRLEIAKINSFYKSHGDPFRVDADEIPAFECDVSMEWDVLSVKWSNGEVSYDFTHVITDQAREKFEKLFNEKYEEYCKRR